MKAVLDYLRDKLLYPFKYDLLYFILLWVIISLPAFYQKVAYPEFFSLTLVLIFYAVTYIVVFLLNLNQHAAKVLKPVALISYTALSVINVYCIYMYNRWFSYIFIRRISGANMDEAREYMETYITVNVVILAVLLFLVVIVLYWFIAKVRIRMHSVIVSAAFIPLFVTPIRIWQHPDIADVLITGKITWSHNEIVYLRKFSSYQSQYWRRITFTEHSDSVDNRRDIRYQKIRSKIKIRSILHISDTHGEHRRLGNLPAADVIVHSGDFTKCGKEAEVIDFLNWFCDLPYRYKIFICGNHETCLYGANIDGLDNNVYYLCNSGVEIDDIKFYGVPMYIKDCISGQQCYNYANIPDDTDVLVTHEPPYRIWDFEDNINHGSKELMQRVIAVAPRIHLFGHIHCQGIADNGSTRYSNGAIMNVDNPNLRIIELMRK